MVVAEFHLQQRWMEQTGVATRSTEAFWNNLRVFNFLSSLNRLYSVVAVFEIHNIARHCFTGSSELYALLLRHYSCVSPLCLPVLIKSRISSDLPSLTPLG